MVTSSARVMLRFTPNVPPVYPLAIPFTCSHVMLPYCGDP